jgi:transcriptional regulator with XRE-family HTH domain
MESSVGSAEVGRLVRAWRQARGLSQLALSLEAGISARHLSFIETGRSTPSREMVLNLARHLDVPLREQNTLLQAAGFAAVHRETPLEATAMVEIRTALEHILNAVEPNPSLVVNRRYDVLLANAAATRFVSFFAPSWRGPSNIARMVLSHDGLRPSLVNFAEVAGYLIHRLRHELAALHTRDAEDAKLLELAIAASGELGMIATPHPPHAILVPARLHRNGLEIELFTTITTLGTPLDITLQELRIETLFPANAAARKWLAEGAERTSAREQARGGMQ